MQGRHCMTQVKIRTERGPYTSVHLHAVLHCMFEVQCPKDSCVDALVGIVWKRNRDSMPFVNEMHFSSSFSKEVGSYRRILD